MQDFSPYTPSSYLPEQHLALMVKKDMRHLKMLAIGHYINAAFTALFSCLFLLYIGLGIGMLSGLIDLGPPAPPNGQMPQEFKMIAGFGIVLIGVTMLLMGWGFAYFCYLSGRWISVQKNRLFSLIFAGVMCAFSFPIGTILGVLTLVVLLRESVIRLYASKEQFHASK